MGEKRENGASMSQLHKNIYYILLYNITFQLTHISIEDGDSFAADLFVCTNMLVDTPVTPPSTANTPLASVQAKE